MYIAVPSTPPGEVRSGLLVNFDRPKSVILSAPSLENIRFAGLISRCRMPLRWACARPSRMSAASWSASFSGRSFPADRRSASLSPRVPPGSSSSARKSWPSHSPASNMVAIWGWLRLESTLASRRKRDRAMGDSARLGARNFSATSRSRRMSRARKTTPIPPAPSGAIIS